MERRPWTDEEDKFITDLVKQHGTKSWSVIADNLARLTGTAQRSGKQCRERWHNHLDPAINKNPWSPEEDEILYSAQRQMGNSWSDIAKLLPGRTDNCIKNHWYSVMRKNARQLNLCSKVGKRRDSNGKSKGRKPAASLAQLQKYMTAAKLCAKEMIEECKINGLEPDSQLVRLHNLTATSSEMIDLSLVNELQANNSEFRSKLKQKLETLPTIDLPRKKSRRRSTLIKDSSQTPVILSQDVLLSQQQQQQPPPPSNSTSSSSTTTTANIATTTTTNLLSNNNNNNNQQGDNTNHNNLTNFPIPFNLPLMLQSNNYLLYFQQMQAMQQQQQQQQSSQSPPPPQPSSLTDSNPPLLSSPVSNNPMILPNDDNTTTTTSTTIIKTEDNSNINNNNDKIKTRQKRKTISLQVKLEQQQQQQQPYQMPISPRTPHNNDNSNDLLSSIKSEFEINRNELPTPTPTQSSQLLLDNNNNNISEEHHKRRKLGLTLSLNPEEKSDGLPTTGDETLQQQQQQQQIQQAQQQVQQLQQFQQLQSDILLQQNQIQNQTQNQQSQNPQSVQLSNILQNNPNSLNINTATSSSSSSIQRPLPLLPTPLRSPWADYTFAFSPTHMLTPNQMSTTPNVLLNAMNNTNTLSSGLKTTFDFNDVFPSPQEDSS